MKKLNETKFVKIEEKELNEIKGGNITNIYDPNLSFIAVTTFNHPHAHKPNLLKWLLHRR